MSLYFYLTSDDIGSRNSIRSRETGRRFLAALSICGALTGCGPGGGEGSGSTVPVPDVPLMPFCSTTSSIAPVVRPGVAAAPSDGNAFYNTIYNATAFAAANARVSNPLTVKPSELSETSSPDYPYRQAYALAVESYVWGLPLELFWMTQGLTATAGINKLSLVNTINTSSVIVSPNTSVLYANGFFDLSRHPFQFTYPNSSINNQLQIMDAYTNVQASVGTRVSPCGGNVVIYWANASYADQVRAAYPNNSIAVYSPQVWLIGRVAVDTYAVQTEGGIASTLYQRLRGTASSPMSLWRSQGVLREYTAQAITSYSNSGSEIRSPVTSKPNSYFEFYSNLAQAVTKNGLLVNYSGVQNGTLNSTSQVYDQTAMFNNFAIIGLTASGFSTNRLSDKQVNGISVGYSNAQAALAFISGSSGVAAATNYWSINNTLGQYAPTYSGWIGGATVALVGLGANLAADGTYPRATIAIDESGTTSRLSGAGGNRYSLQFSGSTLPPLSDQGYWSATVYDARDLLYPSRNNTYYYTNEIGGVYSLGSIQLDDDAVAPTLYFQHTAPTDPAKLPFWIPVPDSTFSVVMRIYNPVAANQSGISTILNPLNGATSANSPQWIPPPVVKY